MVDLIAEVPATYLGLLNYENIVISPSVKGELYTGAPETLEARTAIGALTGLIQGMERAKSFAPFAQSWREYKVGASVMMCNFQTGAMSYLSGCNVKPQTGKEGVNIHAEQMAIAKGRNQGLNRVLGIAVFADPIDDDANPNKLPTLPPCRRCVEMFVHAPEVDDKTIIISTNPDYSACELYTVGTLSSKAPKLVAQPFSLREDEDLVAYDRTIKPHLIAPIYEMFGF